MKKYGIMLLAAGILMISTGCGKAQKSYDNGMELATEGKYEESLTYFEEAIKENKERTEYYIGYGMALNHLNRYEDAKEEFKKAMQDTDNKISKENNKQLYYGMAMAEYGLGEYESVVKYCKKALEIEYLDSLDNDILYTRMAALQLQGEKEQAKKDCETIIKNNEKYMDAYMELAKIENELGESDKAVETYLDAISVDNTYYDAYFALYQQYCSNGQTEQAEEILEQLISIPSKKAKNLVVIGRAYYYKNDYDKAKEYLNMAYDGNSKESLYYLGIVEQKEKSYQKAVEDFEKYIKENKENLNIEVYNQLANAYCELGEYDKAQETITAGISYGSTSAIQDLKKNQVILYEKQNKYKKAKAAAEEYLKIYPEDADMQKELTFIDTRIK